MATNQPIGIIITIFLMVVSVVLIWDEFRAEQRFRAWLAHQSRPQNTQEKSRK